MRLPVWKRSYGRESPEPTAQSVSALAKISFQAVHLSDNLVKHVNGYITALSSTGRRLGSSRSQVRLRGAFALPR
jgi:hypothetical protein